MSYIFYFMLACLPIMVAGPMWIASWAASAFVLGLVIINDNTFLGNKNAS